eukprot:gene21560-22456_t
MTKTTAAPQNDLMALVQRRLSTLLDDTLDAAENWGSEDDGLKEGRRARAISSMARAARDIARLSPEPLPTEILDAPIDVTPSELPSPPPPGDTPDPDTLSPPPPPKPANTPLRASAIVLRARTRTVKAK